MCGRSYGVRAWGFGERKVYEVPSLTRDDRIKVPLLKCSGTLILRIGSGTATHVWRGVLAELPQRASVRHVFGTLPLTPWRLSLSPTSTRQSYGRMSVGQRLRPSQRCLRGPTWRLARQPLAVSHLPGFSGLPHADQRQICLCRVCRGPREQHYAVQQ